MFCVNSNAFKNTSVFFITDSSAEKVKQYFEDNKLHISKNIHICIALNTEIMEKFNITTMPSTFIYDKHNVLKKKLNFTSKINDIITFLNKYN